MKNLILAAITLFAISTAHAQNAVQWKLSDGGNGHWYQFRWSTSLLCWSEARHQCESLGGHLATITSAAENSLLLSLTIPENPRGILGGPYIGGTCEGLPWGQWYWITGEPFGFTAWMPGEPNGSGGATEPYLHFWRWQNLGWNDASDCGGGMFCYLIEWDTDCNNDGIVDYGQIVSAQLADANSDGIPDICQQPTCRDADLFRNGVINGADLGILLSQWGQAPAGTVSDVNRDGQVDGADLGFLLNAWGPCPN